MENKRISQFETTYATDNTSWIPLAQGTPYRNRKIKANTFIQNIIYKVLDNIDLDTSNLVTKADLNAKVQTDVPKNAKFTDTVVDISGKVDKVVGKSLISDSEIQRLASVTNQIIPTVPTKVSQLQNDSNYITASEVPDLGGGDMNKAIYDTNNDGIVDNAKKVNGKTVEKDVPANAKFTDTVYTAGDNITIVDNKISAPGGQVPEGVQEHMDNTDIHTNLSEKAT